MIIGGVTGIGQAIARWLVDHGARNLLLVSRSAASRSQSTDFGRELEALGARVAVENCDVGDLRDLQRVIDRCAESGMPSIKGVVHGGMALDVRQAYNNVIFPVTALTDFLGLHPGEHVVRPMGQDYECQSRWNTQP